MGMFKIKNKKVRTIMHLLGAGILFFVGLQLSSFLFWGGQWYYFTPWLLVLAMFVMITEQMRQLEWQQDEINRLEAMALLYQADLMQGLAAVEGRDDNQEDRSA